jgi:hypothetical protein
VSTDQFAESSGILTGYRSCDEFIISTRGQNSIPLVATGKFMKKHVRNTNAERQRRACQQAS